MTMITPELLIQELESDNSRLFKESVITREAEAANEIFFQGCRLALDSTITFGVKQIPEKSDDTGDGLLWDEFDVAVAALNDRTSTGNLAKDLINQLMDRSTKDQWNFWYRRILIKDLRCGVSVKTVNTATKKYPEFQILVFSVQLAHDSVNHEKKVTGKKIIETKLDGVRLMTIVYPSGRVDQFSRNGKELLNFEQIRQQFSFIASQLHKPMVFDGEVMSASFRDLMKQLIRKADINTTDAALYLFDMMPLEDFEKGICNISQTQRSAYLKNWFEDKIFLQMLNVRIVGQELVDLDTDRGRDRFKEINQAAIAGGFEGIMVKDPSAPYECKRSHAWLKLKPYIDVSLTVIDVNEGIDKNTGSLGALVCTGIDDGRSIVVNVGGGFTDQLRAQIWANHTRLPVSWTKIVDKVVTANVENPTNDEIIGQIVEVRADAVSQNQDGTYSLRFPRFRSFRGFDAGEKI